MVHVDDGRSSPPLACREDVVGSGGRQRIECFLVHAGAEGVGQRLGLAPLWIWAAPSDDKEDPVPRIEHELARPNHPPLRPRGADNDNLDDQLDPNNQSLLYAAINYIYVWNETTQTWTKLSNQWLGSPVLAMAIAPTDSNRIYTVSKDGYIWMSTTAGTSWTQINGNLPTTCQGGGACYISSIAVSPADENLILVGYYHNSPVANKGRLWQCTNPTATPPVWAEVSAYGTGGALPNNAVLSIAPDWTIPANHWYVGTDVGVLYTVNSGASWTNATQPYGLAPNVPVYSLQSTYNYLYAATYGRGLWRINDYCPPLTCNRLSCGTRTNACGDEICCGGTRCCF